MTEKKPKARLHEFYQQKEGTPIYDIQSGPPPPAPPHFFCTVVLPALTSAAGSYPTQEFSGQGSNKKAAENAAAQTALDFIESKGLLPAHLKAGAITVAPISVQKTRAEPKASVDEAAATEFEVKQQLGNRNIEDMQPMELKAELLKALEKNSALKAALSYDQDRRDKAAKLLLGLQVMPVDPSRLLTLE